MNVDKLRAGSDVCLYVGGTKSNPVRTAMVRHSPRTAGQGSGKTSAWLSRAMAGQGRAGNGRAGDQQHCWTAHTQDLGPRVEFEGK